MEASAGLLGAKRHGQLGLEHRHEPQLFFDASDHLANADHLVDAGFLLMESAHYLEVSLAVDEGTQVLLSEKLLEHVRNSLIARQLGLNCHIDRPLHLLQLLFSHQCELARLMLTTFFNLLEDLCETLVDESEIGLDDEFLVQSRYTFLHSAFVGLDGYVLVETSDDCSHLVVTSLELVDERGEVHDSRQHLRFEILDRLN